MGLLTNMEKGDIFFIDEIHRIPKIVEEFLYPPWKISQWTSYSTAASMRGHIDTGWRRFTLIGATTRAGLLSSPLRERFGIVRDLDFYGEQDLVRIVKRSAVILKCPSMKTGHTRWPGGRGERQGWPTDF